jgi:hypothetical protein
MKDYANHLPHPDVAWLPSEPCLWADARWIGLPENPARATYFLARRELELDAVPPEARIHVSADLFYRLRVNGRFVDWGPPRDTQITMAYRSFDVTPLVREGANVIAVEVYQNRETIGIHRHLQERRPDPGATACPAVDRMALICRLDLLDADGRMIGGTGTDDSWRVSPGSAWNARAVRSSLFSDAEVYDARREPAGWTEPGFDDSSWLVPGDDPVATGYAAYPPEQRPHAELHASFVPPVGRELVSPVRVHERGEVTQHVTSLQADIGTKMNLEVLTPLTNGRVEGLERLLASGGVGEASVAGGTSEAAGAAAVVHPHHEHHDREAFYRALDDTEGHPEVPAVREVSVVLDFGELVNGHFLLEVEPSGDSRADERAPEPMFGSPGAPAAFGHIDIAWAQELADGRVHPRLYPSDPGQSGGLFDLSHAVRYTMREGRQVWEAFHYQQFRYVQITFRELEGPLTMYGFAAVRTHAPLVRRGRFESSEPLLDWSYEASDRTIVLCSHDNCMDNIIRERGIYTGDIGLPFLTSGLALYGDNTLLQNAMRLFTRQRENRRWLRMVLDTWTPTPEERPDILIHSVYEAYALCEYLRWAPESEATRSQYYPVLTDLAGYYLGLTNADGLLEDPEGWSFMDWADLDNRRGVVAPQNLMLALVLRELAEISDLLGETNRAKADREAAGRIVDYVRDHHWNESTGLYVDTVVDGEQRTHVFSEHTNTLAMLADIAEGERGTRIVETIFDYDPRHIQSEVGFMIFVLKGLFHAGFGERALELVRTRYNRIAGRGVETIPEEWSWRASVRPSEWLPRWRSVAQTAGCVTPWVIVSEILGIRPTALGFRKATISPGVELLERASGAVATPHGELAVGWRRDGGRTLLDVTVPAGVETVLVVAGEERPLDAGSNEIELGGSA